MQTGNEGGGPFDRIRELYDRAMDLPAVEREAFVRDAPGYTEAEREQALRYLRAEQDGDTLALRERVDADAAGAEPPAPAAGDRVQSTATGELLDKLKTAPKLDDQRFVLEGELGDGGMGVVMKIHGCATRGRTCRTAW